MLPNTWPTIKEIRETPGKITLKDEGSMAFVGHALTMTRMGMVQVRQELGK